MSILNKLLLISLVAFMSCGTKKNVTENSQPITEPVASLEEKEDYLVGTVKYLKNSNCPYIIIDEKTGAKFDPINLDSKEYSVFKNDTEKIYYKYRPLRMMNRCNEAQPIEIEDIKKRED